jgi:cobyrinic acid a,c-diamide synthase
MARCLVISATAPGAGKTTLTLALARAYRDRGLKVPERHLGLALLWHFRLRDICK